MNAAKGKGYRRSWKNLLLDKGYQLRFTLFMVGLSALLMSFLGYWVLQEAKKTTTVGINDVLGRPCPPAPGTAQPGHQGVIVDDITEMRAPTPPAPQESGTADGEESEAGEGDGEAGEGEGEESGAGEGEGEAPAAGQDGEDSGRARVVLDESNMELDAPAHAPVGAAGEGFVDAVAQHYQCRNEQMAKIAGLRAGYQRIAFVLVAVGLLLMVGLSMYGIKMTHRVAGPLHKITLYFDKMRAGRLDQVYDLRKGDQLVEFYEQFKAAHDGLKAIQEQDIEQLRAILEAAEAEGLASRSPDIAAALDELREVLARKEKSLE
jgi:hypothetical protein